MSANFGSLGGFARHFRENRHHFVGLVRENVAKPSNSGDHGRDRSEHANGCARDQSRKQQRDSKRQRNWPDRWRRHLDSVRHVFAGLIHNFGSHALPLSSARSRILQERPPPLPPPRSATTSTKHRRVRRALFSLLPAE